MDISKWRLDGRVALITGSGRGIGAGIGKALADAGAAIMFQDIDIHVAQERAAEVVASGGRAAGTGGDVTDLALAPALVQQTVDQLGGLHILINNAAIQTEVGWQDETAANIRRTLDANLVFPILLAQQAVPHMRQARFGRIINIGSIQQLRGNPKMLPYSASKAAIENLTTGWARSLAPDQITVNCIAPGWFDTYRNRHQITPANKPELGKRVLLGRLGDPEDCAGTALLLCSQAGEYITGQTIYVDGGLSTR